MSSCQSDDFAKTILDKFRQISKEQQELLNQTSTRKTNPPNNIFNRGNGNNDRKRPFDKSGKEELAPGLKETDVGIEKYLSSGAEIPGIIKHRFSDFQVNEIDLDGNVVVLTNTDVPQNLLELKFEPVEINMAVITTDQWRKIEEVASSEGSIEPYLIDVTEQSKEDRGCIHKAVKSMYGSKVISNTISKDELKFIEISKRTKPEARSDWPEGRGKYLHFTMHKVNMDMTEVVHLISDRLKTKANLIGYGGTKDKRAKTTQRMSIKRRTAETLSAMKVPKCLCFGNYEYHDEEIRLGDIKGNQFKIAIRNVEVPDEDINNSLQYLKEHGFINYFGLQRFGFASSPTYTIGKALLANDWKKAVELILKPRHFMKKKKDLFTACKKWFANRRAEEAANCLSKYNNSIEAKVLRTLRTHGDNAFMNALMALPRNTMTMYMHAYQSLIWNKIVSKRIEKYGIKPLPGDLIIDKSCRNIEIVVEDVVQDNLNDEEDYMNELEQSTNKKEKKSQVRVKVLTEEEAENCSIFDIVYPLPGYDIKYPENEISRWYCELLAEDNFKMADLQKVHKNFSLSGAYRNMLAQTESLDWDIIYYSNSDEDIILSDIDILNNKCLNPCKVDGEKRFKAIVLTFCLKSCSYATMALREVMKCDTSSYNQAKLTNFHSRNKIPKLDPGPPRQETTKMEQSSPQEQLSQQIVKMEPQSPQKIVKVEPQSPQKLVKVEPQSPQKLVKVEPQSPQKIVKVEPQSPQKIVTVEPPSPQKRIKLEPLSPQK